MKKFLFGTTALAAVGFAVLASAPANAQTAPAPGFRSNAGFTVGISGYARQFVGVTSNKNAGQTVQDGKIDQMSDWRPIFNFSMPLANGLTAGAVLQFAPLNNTATSTGATRRQWSFVSGAFGQVQLGMADGVAAQMNVGGAEQFTGGAVKNGGKIYDTITAPSGNFAGIVTNTNADIYDNRPGNKINYFSPRFSGFQIGGSYTPEQASGRDGALPTSTTQYRNIMEVSANYVNTLGGVGLRAYGGYKHLGEPSAVGTTDSIRNFHKDAKWYGFGAGVNYMGFDIGGSYAKMKDGRLNTTGTTTTAAALGTVTNDGNAYEFGVNYTFGAFGVGVNYFKGENEAGTADATTGAVVRQVNGDDKRSGISLSGRYVMGPGVNLEAILFQVKQTTGLAASTGFVTTDRSMKANGAMTALILSF